MTIPTISIRAPWALLIADGHKTVENRSWSTPHRGALLIHLCGAGDASGIVALATLSEIVSAEEAHLQRPSQSLYITGPRCWLFDNVIPIIPALLRKGQLGLYPTTIPENMNTNPSLVTGLAVAYCQKASDIALMPTDRDQMQVRVYESTGGGFFFVGAQTPARWYYKEVQDADHFCCADQEALADVVAAGGAVQITGYRFRPIATWNSWEQFAKAMTEK